MSVNRLRTYLERHGIDAVITEYDEAVETVEAASRVAGVPPERIVKSLVLVDGEGRACVCMVPGHRRLDWRKARRVLAAGSLRLAHEEEVRRATGYAAGAVPPLGYPEGLPVFMDARVAEVDRIVAGGGSGSALIEVAASAIRRATGARVADLSA